MSRGRKPKRSNYKKKELHFDISKTIDLSDHYNLLMISFCVAYNDLIHVHKEMINRSSEQYRSYRMYLLKIAISHLREAYFIIQKSFEDESIKPRLVSIPGAESGWQAIVNRVDGTGNDSFARKVLFESRNLIYHYGFKEQIDKEMIRSVAKEMSDGNILGKIEIGESQGETYFEFADLLLMGAILTLGEKYGLTEKEYFQKISNLVAEVISLLDLVIGNFLLSIPGKYLQTK